MRVVGEGDWEIARRNGENATHVGRQGERESSLENMRGENMTKRGKRAGH
jgi:hypothetical protein